MKYSEEQYNSILEDCRAYKNNFDFLQKVSENLLNTNKYLVREIDALREENKRLKALFAEYIKPIDKFIKDRENKAVKEFAEKLKKIVFEQGNPYNVPYEEFSQANVLFMVIDELLKEYEK